MNNARKFVSNPVVPERKDKTTNESEAIIVFTRNLETEEIYFCRVMCYETTFKTIFSSDISKKRNSTVRTSFCQRLKMTLIFHATPLAA